MRSKKIFTLVVLTLMSMTITFTVNAQKNKGVPPVNLAVTIDDGVTSNGTIGIVSDQGGPYVNGQQSVVAQFLSTGVLSFKSGSRNVSAFYSSSLDGGPNPLPASDTEPNVQILTFVNSAYLQTMSIGESRCTPIGVNITVGNYIRTIGYHAGRGTITNTGPALVSHPDNDTWIVDSNTGGACSLYDDVARVRDAPKTGKPGDIDHGRYLMPMRLILTRQP